MGPQEATPPTTILAPPLGGWQEDDGTSDLGHMEGLALPGACPLPIALVPACL